MSDPTPISELISKQIKNYWRRRDQRWNAIRIAAHLGYPVDFVAMVIFGNFDISPDFPYTKEGQALRWLRYAKEERNEYE
tara:strand:+ start:1600 stop:1839 length:240 start_codon:yes stop_codon:yes gene_type:complete